MPSTKALPSSDMRILIVLTAFLSSVAFAAFSVFAHVTPETREKFEMPVCVSTMADDANLMKVTFPLSPGLSNSPLYSCLPSGVT